MSQAVTDEASERAKRFYTIPFPSFSGYSLSLSNLALKLSMHLRSMVSDPSVVECLSSALCLLISQTAARMLKAKRLAFLSVWPRSVEAMDHQHPLGTSWSIFSLTLTRKCAPFTSSWGGRLTPTLWKTESVQEGHHSVETEVSETHAAVPTKFSWSRPKHTPPTEHVGSSAERSGPCKKDCNS